MMHAPFSLFRRGRKDGSVWWWARFWDYKSRRFAESHPLDIQYHGMRKDCLAACSKATAMLQDISLDVADSLFVPWAVQFWTPGKSKYLRQKELGAGEPLSVEYVTNNRRGLELYARTYPGFRKLRVSELATADLQDWQLWMLEQEVGRRRINQIIVSGFSVYGGLMLASPFSISYKTGLAGDTLSSIDVSIFGCEIIPHLGVAFSY